MTTEPTPNPIAVKLDDAAKLLSLTPQQVDDLVRAGKLPKPIKLGHRTRIWSVDALRAFVNEKAGLNPTQTPAVA